MRVAGQVAEIDASGVDWSRVVFHCFSEGEAEMRLTRMSGADLRKDGRRYETGSIAYSLFDAWIPGLELLQEVGIAAIYQRVLSLTDQIISGLRSKKYAIASPVEYVSERSAIISFGAGSAEANSGLHQRLLQQGIHTAMRDGRIRVSPNFFNNETDIERLLDAMAAYRPEPVSKWLKDTQQL